jgi:hypothetical protein
MDATITNLGSVSPDDDLFLTLGRVELKAGESVVIPDIGLEDLDSDPLLSQQVLDGLISVAISEDAVDVATATTGRIKTGLFPSYTVAELAALTGVNGRYAYASDGRTGAETAGNGTGCPVIYSNGEWRRFEDMAIVAA